MKGRKNRAEPDFCGFNPFDLFVASKQTSQSMGKSGILSDVNKHIYTIAREEFEVVFSNKIDCYK